MPRPTRSPSRARRPRMHQVDRRTHTRPLSPSQRDGPHPQDSRDSGVATIWTAMAVAALSGVAVLGCLLGAAVVARHRAESAADLGALAAASHAAEGPVQACERARWIADRMAGSLLSCRWQR